MSDESAASERIRLIIDTEEALRRAVRMRAALTGGTPSTVINDLIRTHLAEEVAEAVRRMAKTDHPPHPGRKRP